MTESLHQTLRIAQGRHVSPDQGACVVELASMLAGEPFSDHPRSVCPVIAGFLRNYNDLLPDAERGELYPYASLVVGTAASRGVRARRARRLAEWADRTPSRGRFARSQVRLRTWDMITLPVAEAALRMDPQRRRIAVAVLLEELADMGRPAVATGADESTIPSRPAAPVGPT